MNYRECSKCRFSCSVKIPEEQADKIFSWTPHRKYLCIHSLYMAFSLSYDILPHIVGASF
jgi:hypothetical protein